MLTKNITFDTIKSPKGQSPNGIDIVYRMK